MKQKNNLLSSLLAHVTSVPIGILKTVLILALIVPSVVFAGTSGPAPIPPAPAFQISTAMLNLCRGVVNRVPVLVSNPGSQPMTSLQIGLVSSRNIYAIGNGTVNQASVPANGTKTVLLPIFVSLNTSSLISVGVTVNYNWYYLYSDSEIRNVSFGVETCPSSLSIQTSPLVTSGRIENMTLNLTNIGNTVLNAISLRASLPAQSAAILTSQPRQIGALGPGETEEVTERVFMFRNASQSFPLNISVSMYNGTSPVQLLDTIVLLSTGLINITSSSVTLSPAIPTPGSIFSVSLILTDTGTAGASAVTVTPLPPRGITPYGSNSVFVGDMAVDTQIPVTMTLRANASLKSGSYTIPVKISYLNNLRNNLNTTILVPISIGAGFASNFTRTGGYTRLANGGGPGYFVILLLIIVVVLVVLFIFYIRRKGMLKRFTHKTK